MLALSVLLACRPAPGPPASLAEAPGSNPAALRHLSREFTEISERVLPAVVSIDAVKVDPSRPLPGGDPFFRPLPEEELFLVPDERIPSVGSGFLIRQDGYVVTNRHVVEGLREVRVTLADGRVAPARQVGSDPSSDLAVLKVEFANLPVLEWGSSEDLRVGEWVLAYGSPFHMEGSVTHGIISAKGRQGLGIADDEDFLQTDAPINPGNSGGPLVNLEGRVVGINTAILSETGASHGIGLAIPSDTASKLVQELLETGRVERSWLGLLVQPVDESTARRLGLQRPAGLLVVGGYKRSPAGQAGFLADDLVLEIGGHRPQSEGDARTALARVPVGRDLVIRLWRDRAVYEVTLKTGVRGLDSRGRPVRGI